MKRVIFTFFLALTISIAASTGFPSIFLADISKSKSASSGHQDTGVSLGQVVGSNKRPKDYERASLAPQSSDQDRANRDLRKFLSSDAKSIKFPADISDEELGQINAKSFPELSEAYFENCNLSNQGISNLVGLKLHKLYFTACTIDDQDISPLTEIPSLKILSLNGTLVGDEAMKSISSLPLEKLYLNDTFISDKGVNYLAQLPLKKLYLEGTEIGNQAVALISKTKIEALNLSNTDIDGGAIAELKKMTALKSLYIRETVIDPARFSELNSSIKLAY